MALGVLPVSLGLRRRSVNVKAQAVEEVVAEEVVAEAEEVHQVLVDVRSNNEEQWTIEV